MEADDLRTHESGHDVVGDHQIADQLHALEAERVLQRALELEAQSLSEPHVISAEQLDRIADEIGVDRSFVQQALGEIRLGATERSWFSRFVLPDDLVETAQIQGMSRSEADAAIAKWMTNNEGLMQGGSAENGIEWHVDRRLRSRIKTRSISGKNRISRVAGGTLTHRVHSSSDQEHTVAVEAEGLWPLTFAAVVLALGAGLSITFLLSAVASGDLVVGAAGFAGIIATAAAAAIAGARYWGRSIRGALRRSLAGLVTAAQSKPRFRLPRFRRRRPKK